MFIRKLSRISPLYFLLSPLFAFVTACSNLNSRLNGLTFALFYGFFGYAHSFIDPRPDAYRKMISFSSFPSTISYEDIVQEYINGQLPDVIERLLYVFVRTFTSDAHILLLIVGTVGGFFLYLVFRKVIKYCDTDDGRGFYVIVFLMVILHSPAVIGGIRFFLAFPIFLYGTFLFLVDKKNVGLIWLLISPLAHFSFILSVLLIILLRFYKGNVNILWWCTVFLCIASIFFNATSFNQLFDGFEMGEYNQNIDEKAELYSSVESMNHFNESLTTHLMRIQQYVTRLFVLILLFTTKFTGIQNRMISFDLNFYKQTLVLLSFGYFFVSFNVVGERYLLPGIFFTLILLYRLCHIYKSCILTRLLHCSFVFFVFNIGWVFFNTYVEIDWHYLIFPLPFFMI